MLKAVQPTTMKSKLWLFLYLLSWQVFAQIKPNIVFILADDMGYGDVGAFNKQCQIKTPNLDKMATSGLVFTDAHSSSAVCTPTRYGILTGRYNWRSPLKSGVLTEYGSPLIPQSRTTMASMLKKQGYKTACIGKWHLGFNWATTDGLKPTDNIEKCNLDYTKAITGGPVDVGFDYFFGIDAPNYPPFCFMENRQLQGNPSHFYAVRYDLDCRAGHGVKNWKMEAILPELRTKTVKFIENAADSSAPFFLYLPLTAPHTPIVPSTPFLGQSGLNKYADFVMEVDNFVGVVMAALQKKGILDNTIVVFTSDNGCSPQADFSYLKEKRHNPNYFFRGHKADIFEGGHHVPLIVQWPKKIKPNQSCKQTICLNDFMATFAQISHYSLSDNEAEDSYNLLPLFLKPNSSRPIREATVHHSINGSFTIRQGDWKLILCAGSGGWSFPKPGKEEAGLPKIQLYNLKKDIAEQDNVEAQNPLIVKKMTNLLRQYVRNGRSTKGKPQTNDGVFLHDRMDWLTHK
jgi:arylsulfatase A